MQQLSKKMPLFKSNFFAATGQDGNKPTMENLELSEKSEFTLIRQNNCYFTKRFAGSVKTFNISKNLTA